MVETLILMEKFDIKKNCAKFTNSIKLMHKYNICFKIGWENNKILPWIKITNFVIRTFTPIIYQNSYPITVKGCEVTENIIGIHQFTVDQLSNNENLIYISSIYFPNKSLLTYLSLKTHIILQV